jgi:hypothetical protein
MFRIEFSDSLVVFVALYSRDKAFEYFVAGQNFDLLEDGLRISRVFLDNIGVTVISCPFQDVNGILRLLQKSRLLVWNSECV